MTTAVLLYLLSNCSASGAPSNTFQGLRFHPRKSRQSSIAVAMISSFSCLLSIVFINHHAPRKASLIGVRELCFLILQCITYGALTHLMGETSDLDQTSSNARKQQFLRNTSALSFTTWTIFLTIFHEQRLNFQAPLFILGALKALGYFILFSLVSGTLTLKNTSSLAFSDLYCSVFIFFTINCCVRYDFAYICNCIRAEYASILGIFRYGRVDSCAGRSQSWDLCLAIVGKT